MENKITVVGTSAISVKPDYVNVQMKLSALKDTTDQAMETAARLYQTLRKQLICALDGEPDLRTTEFTLNASYNRVFDQETKEEKSVFKGYEVEQWLTLGMDLDQVKVKRALAAIARSNTAEDLKVRFLVKNPKEINNQLYLRAAANAKEKAEALCKGVGARLGDVKSIDYSSHNEQPECDLDIRIRACYCAVDEAPDVEPENVTVKDSVRISWEIV